MTGFLIHLHIPWHGVRHLLFVERDEFAMLKAAAESPAFKIPLQWERSRIVRCFTTQQEWDVWARHRLVDLCSECDHGRRAA